MILVCAATGTEAACCRRGIGDARAHDLEVLVTGVGLDRAAEALAGWLARAAQRRPRPVPSLVVSAGFAGALGGGLEPLSWVTASAVYRVVDGGAARVPLAPGLLRVARDATPCHVVSTGEVVTSGVRALGSPAVADMESAALAEVAAAAGLPFAVLRLVTDTPGRPLAEVGRTIAATLAARGVVARGLHGARSALAAVRSPLRTAVFLRDTGVWRERLRRGWREQASRGVQTDPAP